jgi:N-acetylmuramoyl-L-alanine amidase
MTDRKGRPGSRPFARARAGSAPPIWLAGAALAVCGLALGGCGPAGAAGAAGASRSASRAPARPSSPPPVATPVATGSASPSPSPAVLPLAGKIIGIDPGHNGGNFNDPGTIGQEIWNGTGWETCDTTGTTTDGGYTEAQFNFNVALDLRADLRRDGARVVMTRTSNDGVGPCVNTRSAIINNARADVAVDIHADGGPASGRGFTILEPVADGPNDHVIAASQQFGNDVRQALLAETSMPESDYTGTDGILPRDDLAGLNLTTVPKVLVECGNMRNLTDAQLLVTAGFQALVARALTAAIVRFLDGQGQG